ncbi:MAG TPA: NADH-ubiquinone oxidoreductase-F iron-sulfur binding region domain-containing protein [Solirubrobacteraceae bacterium]
MTGRQRAPTGLPRLLSAIPAEGTMSLREHVAAHGEPPLAHSRRERREAAALIDEIEHAGLLGRGGAAFPTAIKMRAVARARGQPVVVVNGAEGEPASLKDRTLLTAVPHLVLDGALLAAQAIGAEKIIVCALESDEGSLKSLARALDERPQLGASPPAIRLVTVPDRYVAGQESALVNHLNGGPATPTFTPPLPIERGVGHRPTLVNNTETLAHIALIARHGPKWFRQLGTTAQPGSTLITLSGPVAYPGVYEIEHGASLASLIDAAGGNTTAVRAGLFGGYAGAWISGERLGDITLSNEQLAPHRASLGAGVILLLSEDACPVAETARVARWLADQSAGQCGPCVHGLDAIATTIEDVADGAAQSEAKHRIVRLASLTRRRGACNHPDGTVRFILTALEVFGAEFADHAQHGPCDACQREGELPLPDRTRPIAAPV